MALVEPAFPLKTVKSALGRLGLVFGHDAASDICRLGLDSSDVATCISFLHPDDFAHSSDSPWCAALRQDTYRCRYLTHRIALRLHLDDTQGVVVSAFARSPSR